MYAQKLAWTDTKVLKFLLSVLNISFFIYFLEKIQRKNLFKMGLRKN